MGLSASKNSEGQKTRRNLKKPKPEASPVASAGIILDGAGQPFIDDGFGQPKRYPKARDDNHSFPLDGFDISSVSDEQLAQYFLTAPKLHEYGGVDVVRLSKSLAMKGGDGVPQSESHNMIFAAETLHLPVPKVHCAFMSDTPGCSPDEVVKGHFILMDYISGPTVDECWESLDVGQRESVAGQVASMMNKMQTTPLQLPPGPIGRPKDEKFEGPWFTDYGAGPFEALKDLENWCNHKIDVCIKVKELPENTPRFQFQKLVLTHQDITPRNLILDTEGKVWLIDWGLAGVYPPGFEQAILKVNVYSHEGFREMVFAGLSNWQERVIEQFKAIAYGLSVGARL